MTRRLPLTLGWFVLLAVFFRWWDLTNRFPPLAVWSCVFLFAFALTLRISHGPEGLRQRAARWRMGTWAALIAVALVANVLVPQVPIRDALVRTVVFVKLIDTVVPLWILARALIVIWTGPARVVALASLVPTLGVGLYAFVVGERQELSQHRGDAARHRAAGRDPRRRGALRRRRRGAGHGRQRQRRGGLAGTGAGLRRPAAGADGALRGHPERGAPVLQLGAHGSRVYAAAARRRGDRIAGMLSLETVGYFTDEPGSQRYPPPFNLLYPDRGNFIGFVGNLDSRPLVRRAIATFRDQARLPSEGVAAPALIPGISWSDHLSFWLHGWQALMITDTAPFRNPYYHMRTDTADRLDYPRMARLITGLRAVVERLAGA